MPTINVNDAYVLNETGAEVDKVTGLFTKDESTSATEKAQARYNIAAGGSNPNLIDNAYFVGGGSQLGDGHFPINQKGQTSYSVGPSATGIDRWYTINANSVYTLQSDELVVSSSSFSVLGQKIFNPIPAGTYTLSIKMGSVGASQLALYVDFADGGVSDFRPSAAAGEIVTSTFTATAPITFVRFFTDNGNSFSVQAVKLELGTVSTLANDPPPDFGEELRKCQHYLYAVTFPGYSYTGQICFALDATNINWVITTQTPMVQNKLPSITVTNSLYANGVAISNYAIVNYPYGNNVKVSAQAGGLTNGQLYPITTSASEVKVLISTEL